MENSLLIMKVALSVILAAVVDKVGSIGPLLFILMLSMIGDYMTGLINAGIQGRISSFEGIKGILKKALYLVAVCVGVGVDGLVYYSTSAFIGGVSTTFFGALVTVWLIVNELISILENIASYVPLPSFLSKMLNQVKDTVENLGESQTKDHASNNNIND